MSIRLDGEGDKKALLITFKHYYEAENAIEKSKYLLNKIFPNYFLKIEKLKLKLISDNKEK